MSTPTNSDSSTPPHTPPPASGPLSPRHRETADHTDPYLALRHPSFRFFLLGYFCFASGYQALELALGWELYQKTHSPLALGLVGLAQVLPVILLALPAGFVADKFSRKRVMATSLAFIAAASLGLGINSLLDGPYQLSYVLILIAGIGRAFHAPARSALLPSLVPTTSLSNAITWSSNTFHVATTAGPMMGGLALAAFNSFPLIYWTSSLCTLALILILTYKVRIHRLMEPAKEKPPLGEGLRFVWRTKMLLSAMSLDLFAVLFGGATALLPVFSKDILFTDASGLGWLRSAPAIGSFAMGFLLAHLPRSISPLHNMGKSLFFSVFCFGLCMIGFGLSHHFFLSMVFLFLSGAFDNVSVVIRGILTQKLTPDRLRGRVAAISYVFIGSSNELGAVESGFTAQWFGPVPAVVGGGLMTLVVTLVIWTQSTALRRVKELEVFSEPKSSG